MADKASDGIWSEDVTQDWMPKGYGQEASDYICDNIAVGISLRSMLLERDPDNPKFPSSGSVFNWLKRSPSFQANYTAARGAYAEAIFDECVEIADGKGVALEDIAARKLQIYTRQWAAGKLLGKYSEKIKHVGGDEGDAPIKITGVELTIVDPEV